ncbi:TonB-dependent receptor [Rubritalea tangerina]|uniref:TonB-dependent receptor n=1 Tax=Rubritalea tangerina TaxID=430798 RepID=A0ABW4Z8Y5_9BACT
MKTREVLSSYNKALRINLDQTKYGTFAEIGAGQEVVNWFFKASATAGTVAKSISAYDMTMSDEIYGKSQRYVSRERVTAMLDHEYELLIERLAEERNDKTTFFSYCNTVRARGYKDKEECHGWMGVRLQLKPGGEPCDILCHVRLLDEENMDQMEALGVMGLNLIYASFYHRDNLERFVESLVDNIPRGRVEVDMLKFLGEGFRFVDNRLCSLQLVRSGLTAAAMFTPDGEVVQPAEVLYKRSVALLRGSFDPVTNLHMDMLTQTKEKFCAELNEKQKGRFISLCEISMNNLLRGEGGEIDHVKFLDRADALQALGQTLLISNCPEFHRIAAYLSVYTREPIAIILSIGLLNELFKEKWSENLDGGILESFGRLFKHSLSLYVYPWKNRKDGELVTAESFRASDNFKYLYQHLLQNRLIRSVESGNEELLNYTGRDIQKMIAAGGEEWKELVPEVAHRAAMHIH